MSSKSNVNPDHYKTAGRGRQGEDVVPELEKQRLAAEQEARARRSRRPPRRARGAAKTGKSRE
jgi:hypothetical protein